LRKGKRSRIRSTKQSQRFLNTLQTQCSETHKEVKKKARADKKRYVEKLANEAEKVAYRGETRTALWKGQEHRHATS